MQSKHPATSFIIADYIARLRRIGSTVAATIPTTGHGMQP